MTGLERLRLTENVRVLKESLKRRVAPRGPFNADHWSDKDFLKGRDEILQTLLSVPGLPLWEWRKVFLALVELMELEGDEE